MRKHGGLEGTDSRRTGAELELHGRFSLVFGRSSARSGLQHGDEDAGQPGAEGPEPRRGWWPQARGLVFMSGRNGSGFRPENEPGRSPETGRHVEAERAPTWRNSRRVPPLAGPGASRVPVSMQANRLTCARAKERRGGASAATVE